VVAIILAGVAGYVYTQIARSSYLTGRYVEKQQPVQFSHKHHVGDDGIDCRYCHTAVETSSSAGIPPTQTCMNCHSQIWSDSPYFVLGAGRGSRDLFYVTLGAGIGGALIFDGKIWRGASGFAGEFGQVAINSDGMKLEDVASSANIVRRTRSRFHQDSTSSLNQLDEEEIRLKDVVRAAQNDDDFARLMLERTGTYVGTAIASVINLLNIERIVVGGVIMQAEHLVLDAIIKRAKELSFAPSFEATHIVGGEIGANAAAVGVALLSRENEH
jgi:hypothetical protein